MKSTYCEYILEKILSTSEVGPILALIAPSPFNLQNTGKKNISTNEIRTFILLFDLLSTLT